MRALELADSRQWAITHEGLETIREIAARENATPEAVAAKLGRPLDNSRSVTVRDGVAVVPLEGPFFRRANLFTELSGATSVEILAADFRRAFDDPKVRAIILEIDSPGGDVAGTGELAAMIRAGQAEKPVIAYADFYCCSGAYWLATACSEIVVAPSSVLGSVGVVAAYRRGGRSDTVEFVSDQSPNKRPDLDTEAGKAQVQRTVNALAQVFIDAVADYRGVSVEHVIEEFGAGGLLVGQAAVDAGMADRVGTFEGVLAELSTGAYQRPQARPPLRIAASIEPAAAQQSPDEGATTGDASAPHTGATPMAEETQPGANPTVTPPPAVEPKATASSVSAAEVEALRQQAKDAADRLTRVEADNATLRAAEQRRELTDTLSALTFAEGRTKLAPAARTGLVEALIAVAPGPGREAILAAVKGIQFVECGERGFTDADASTDAGNSDTLSAAEAQVVAQAARSKRVSVAEATAQFIAARKARTETAAARN